MTCKIKYFSRLPEKIFMIRWDFWGFLLADVIANMYIGETETNVIIHLQLKLTTWRKNYNWADFWMRPMTSNTILWSTDRFAAHTSCKYANDAENLFLFLSENAGNATYTEYINMRNQLLVFIHTHNGHQSSVSTNLALEEFQLSFKTAESYIIPVQKHKTFCSYGHAFITSEEKYFK